MPVSAIWPLSSTTIWTALRTVDSRRVMAMVVRPPAKTSKASARRAPSRYPGRWWLRPARVSADRAPASWRWRCAALAAGEAVPADADHRVVPAA